MGGALPGDAIAMSGWDHLEDFLRYLRVERQLSPHTLRDYRLDLTQFLEFLPGTGEGRTWGRSPTRICEPFWPRPHRDRKSTVARKLSTLRTFFKYLQRRGVASQNPAKLAPSPKLDKILPHFLTVDEAFHLLAEPQGDDFGTCRDRAILEVFYGGGLRLSELAGLNLGDLDLAPGCSGSGARAARNGWPFWGNRRKRRLTAYLPPRQQSVTQHGTRDEIALFVNPAAAACPPARWPG